MPVMTFDQDRDHLYHFPPDELGQILDEMRVWLTTAFNSANYQHLSDSEVALSVHNFHVDGIEGFIRNRVTTASPITATVTAPDLSHVDPYIDGLDALRQLAPDVQREMVDAMRAWCEARYGVTQATGDNDSEIVMNVHHIHRGGISGFMLDHAIRNSDDPFATMLARYPESVQTSFRALADDGEAELAEAWYQFRAWKGGSYRVTSRYLSEFNLVLDAGNIRAAGICDDCSAVGWADDLDAVSNGHVCESCRDDYATCARCGDLSRDTQTVDGDDEYCESCRQSTCHWCDECDVYYRHSNHNHTCECKSAEMSFTFPNNGKGVVTQDERFTVTLAKGEIDKTGMVRIHDLVAGNVVCSLPSCQSGSLNHLYHSQISEILDAVGPTWQTKRGNFTRRLSSALSKQNHKLPPATISEIGNLARAHSDTEASWDIELTRDLNLSASDFYHNDSCWWNSYSYSRCALKTWGGMGLRTFNDQGDVTGRAWVQPVRDIAGSDLIPAQDTMAPTGYVIFNGYGELSGYVPARIIAYLTGKTYRRVGIDTERMYVNGSTGYLVADEATCADHDRVSWSYSEHDQY